MTGTVLIIDDNPDTLEATGEVLKSGGMTVVVAARHEKAWEIFRASTPDVLIMDVMMPQVDGFTLARQMLAERWTPTIFLSSIDSAQERQFGFEAGGLAYFARVDERNTLDVLIAAVHCYVKLNRMVNTLRVRS